MHRAFEITVTPAATDALIRDLEKLDFSINLSVHRAASIKPPGAPGNRSPLPRPRMQRGRAHGKESQERWI